MLHQSGSQELCCSMARASYIGSSNEILNMFEFATPAQVLSAVQTYSCALYGSNLWDLYGTAAGKLYRSWNTTCKMAHGLPPQCHTYIVEYYLSGPLPSLRQILLKRYVQFVQKLFSCENPVISWGTPYLEAMAKRAQTCVWPWLDMLRPYPGDRPE